MPELPEVETVRRGLAPVLEGRRLEAVRANRPDLRFALPEGFVQRLIGARVGPLERRAKYLLAPLDRGDTLVMHLGMTGRFEISRPPELEPAGRIRAKPLEEKAAQRPAAFHPPPPPDPKHAHVIFETDEAVRITYFDPRRFGFMDLIATRDLADHPWFKALGPEPLGPDFTAAGLAAAFKDRRQSPKTLLLDQRIVAGLGNIYVCEALHRARISPLVAAGALSKARLAALAEAVRAVLVEAIAAGGSTLRDFAAADGALGYFQHAFRVYGREGEACLRPACRGVVRRIVQGGRSTFFCPVCQR
jgi:formamidopyrimidine-DNA glycosylase